MLIAESHVWNLFTSVTHSSFAAPLFLFSFFISSEFFSSVPTFIFSSWAFLFLVQFDTWPKWLLLLMGFPREPDELTVVQGLHTSAVRIWSPGEHDLSSADFKMWLVKCAIYWAGLGYKCNIPVLRPFNWFLSIHAEHIINSPMTFLFWTTRAAHLDNRDVIYVAQESPLFYTENWKILIPNNFIL